MAHPACLRRNKPAANIAAHEQLNIQHMLLASGSQRNVIRRSFYPLIRAASAGCRPRQRTSKPAFSARHHSCSSVMG